MGEYVITNSLQLINMTYILYRLPILFYLLLHDASVATTHTCIISLGYFRAVIDTNM